jgi:hypothetical protein
MQSGEVSSGPQKCYQHISKSPSYRVFRPSLLTAPSCHTTADITIFLCTDVSNGFICQSLKWFDAHGLGAPPVICQALCNKLCS